MHSKYFEQAYGIRFLSPLGISTESEASAADVASMPRKLKKITHQLFSENISIHVWLNKLPEKLALTVAGVLYTDALSEPRRTGFYLHEMMEHNVTAIATAAVIAVGQP